MTVANGSIAVTPGSGASVATHLAGGLEHQVMMLANENGHLLGSLPTFIYSTALAAGAANKVYIDIFNATGSGKVVKLRKLFVTSNSAAVTGVPINWTLARTTSVGTGGTVLTAGQHDLTQTLHANITARHAPTGGAATGGALFGFYITSEETIAANAIAGMINWLPEHDKIADLVLAENEGVKLTHVTSSTTGSWVVTAVITAE